jgi:WD40 repeat protein
MRLVLLALAAWLMCGPATLSRADSPGGNAVPADEIDRLVLQLGDDDMAKRTAAAARLEAIGESAVAGLKKAVESSDDPEVRKAAKALLEKLAAKAQGLLHDFRGSNPRVNSVAISADGKRAVSASMDGALRYWDLENFLLIRQIVGHQGDALCVALSPDGKRILSGGSDHKVKLWDLGTGAEIHSLVGHANTVTDVAFSSDGKTALSVCADGRAPLWDVSSGKLLRTLETQTNGRVTLTIAFAPDGKQAVTAGRPDTYVQLWDVATGETVRRFEGHAQGVYRVAISPDGKRLLSAGFDSTVRLWDMATGKQLKQLDAPGSVYTLIRFTPDGTRAIRSFGLGGAGVARDGDPQCGLILWDLATGKEIKQFGGHRNPLICFAVSADGRRLISGSTDGSMRVWELPR